MSKLPSLKQIEEWITENPEASSRRDIARAFGLKSNDKAALVDLLRKLKAKNSTPQTSYQAAEIVEVTPEGEGVAVLHNSEELVRIPNLGALFGTGDEVLLHIGENGARVVRKIDRERPTFVARFEDDREGGKLVTVNKGRNQEYKANTSKHKLETGDLVVAELVPTKKIRKKFARETARIISVIGNMKDRHILSQLSIEEYGLSDKFSDKVEAEAKSVIPADVPREDLTGLPFTTIDPHDARDHDDAIYVEPWGEGFRLYVAIADVAAFVREGSALDGEALARGNSVYFPDRVLPMLPDHLSGDLCSLHENVVRPVIFVAMDINKHGRKMEHRFGRGNISSRASLAYETAQAIEDGEYTGQSREIQDQIKLLFKCYRAMAKATLARGSLHLDLPERKIELGEDGQIKNIGQRDRLDAHKLVEEAMVMANVAAAQSLEAQKTALLYRIHEDPKPEKAEALRLIAKAAGYKISRGDGISSQAINALLDHAAKYDNSEAISMQVLRSLRQAQYSPQNLGHFGLALKRYAHFTSPIRRYADLVVHRALVAAFDLGEDGHVYDDQQLDEIAGHISSTERTAMQAERDTNDRYVAQFLQSHLDKELEGRISGVSKFGFFVTLNETHADGFVPLRLLGDDQYFLDRAKDIIRGKRTGRVFKIGQEVLVKIFETNALSGGIEMTMLAHEGKPMDTRSPRKKFSRSKKKKFKGKKK